MKLEIAIHCVMYQHRLCWMLSSILQQTGDKPDIVVSLSHAEDGGNPTTPEVIDFFTDKGLNIISMPLPDKHKGNRAIPRNMRAKDTEADWILYADSDMVYEPEFFADIKRQLQTDQFKNEHRVIGADRVSLNIDFCVKYFEEDKRKYPCIIEDPADICAEFPVKWVRGKGIAAGNFQLARVEAIRERGSVYSGRKRDYWRRTKSDRQFRVHMGGRVPMDTLLQFHLNHDRGGPEIQR